MHQSSAANIRIQHRIALHLFYLKRLMTKSFRVRLRAAGFAAAIHLSGTVLVAALSATLVFGLWYPFPYRYLAGGRELFLLVISVDIVLGPLLTLVIFSPTKMPKELWRDLAIVVVLQLGALGYGVWSVWQARPLFLVAEIDRFKVIARPGLADGAMEMLPRELQPSSFSGPITAAIREPKDAAEKDAVLFASIQGGRDYGERPDFYIPYEGVAALKSLKRARPLETFLQRYPLQRAAAQDFASKAGLRLESMKYLPVIARQEWIAMIDDHGKVVGFLKGDGF
jgi:hypothetical protein